MFKQQDKDHKEISQDEIIAFLGRGTEFKGVIAYQQGTIRIDGRVEGEIIAQGVLVVGESAEVYAEINAGTVISSGRITGNITATDRIQLLPTAVLEGSIRAPILVIEEGVRFNGQCQMAPSGTGAQEEAMVSMAGEEARGQGG